MDISATSGLSATAAYAGFWRRFGGAFIDGVIIGVVEMVLFFILTAVAGRSGTALGALLAVLFSIGYYIVGWGNGQTVGCSALNMRVVDATTGGAPGYGKAAIRYIVQFILGLTFFLVLIGDLWMIWDARKQTWQDKVAGTVVVMV